MICLASLRRPRFSMRVAIGTAVLDGAAYEGDLRNAASVSR